MLYLAFFGFSLLKVGYTIETGSFVTKNDVQIEYDP